MSEGDTRRALHRRDRYRLTKGTNLGTIQGFPQLWLIKKELGIKTIGGLEAWTEYQLLSAGVETVRLKRFFENKGYTIDFAKAKKS